jgi:hypothetical protein
MASSALTTEELNALLALLEQCGSPVRERQSQEEKGISLRLDLRLIRTIGVMALSERIQPHTCSSAELRSGQRNSRANDPVDRRITKPEDGIRRMLGHEVNMVSRTTNEIVIASTSFRRN